MEVCGGGENLLDIHIHCRNCIKIWKCHVRPREGESCEIVSCEVECGARFHACKRTEHKLLCYNEKVPCINQVNGCPLWLPRRHLGRHLETCPASVVHCTMEWNRWPVCSRERQMHIPFHQPNPIARAGQLDVALALRDQRMLNEWLRAPRRTRRALRNSLTRRFPAVPLQIRADHHGTTLEGVAGEISSSSSCHPSRTVTDDEEDTPWEMRKAPPGLQSSVCSELYRASKQTTESLTAALTMIMARDHGRRNGTCVTLPQSMSNSEKASLRLVDPQLEDKENLNGLANGWVPDVSVVEDMEVEKAGPYQLLRSSSATLSHGETMDLGLEIEVVDDVYEAPGNYDILFVDHTVVSEISSASMTDHARKAPSVVPPIPPPPPMSPPLFVNLGLDLTLESITRYQAKPKSMYTFLCAQEFRRDEYGWHYKNVHSDIHGGLNGWLEQRCPLAHYGCMYSLRRFFPTCCGSLVIHNNILESFGVRPYIPDNFPALSPPSSTRTTPERSTTRYTSSCSSSSSRRCDGGGAIGGGCRTNGVGPMEVIHETVDGGGDSSSSSSSVSTNGSSSLVLTQLPFEVLQHVARFLDSFSMCNLSMTNRLMREVCCSLLEERGIVVQQWERKRCGNRYTWRIAYKRWFFSTAFTPIREWGFEDQENMANHLKSCSYFQRNFKTDPYFYPIGISPKPHVYRKLKAGIEESLQKESSSIGGRGGGGGDTTTKL